VSYYGIKTYTPEKLFLTHAHSVTSACFVSCNKGWHESFKEISLLGVELASQLVIH